jgi:RNA polymerase sigma factor (TIGR02999 family)
VDHFRERNAQKRPLSRCRIAIDELVAITEERRDETLIVDEALTNLEKFDARAAEVVELRYFLGLSESEIADVLEIGLRTVRRDWVAAQAWLKHYLKQTNISRQ